MANPKTLIPGGHKLTLEEQSKGGKKSAEVRRQKKSLREKAELFLSLSIKDEKDIEKAKSYGLTEEDMDLEIMNLVHMQEIIRKENYNSVGAFNSLKDLRLKDTEETREPKEVKINIVDNSNLEGAMYEDD